MNPSTPRPFANNLDKDNRVFDTVRQRYGAVSAQPRESSRGVMVLFDGGKSPQWVDVMQLRLVLDGKIAEDVPPIDGEPPQSQERAARTPRQPRAAAPAAVGGLEALKAEREAAAGVMADCVKRYKEQKAIVERLDLAIGILTGNPAPGPAAQVNVPRVGLG